MNELCQCITEQWWDIPANQCRFCNSKVFAIPAIEGDCNKLEAGDWKDYLSNAVMDVVEVGVEPAKVGGYMLGVALGALQAAGYPDEEILAMVLRNTRRTTPAS